MNRISAFLALIPFLTLLSCNKDDDANPSGKKTLDFIQYTTYPDSAYYDFNSMGQIIREEASESRSTVTINGDQLHLVEYRKTESRNVADITYHLNAAGNVESGTGSISYIQSEPYTSAYSFEYNSDGYMTRRTDTRSNGDTWSFNYYWTNGDLTKMEWVYQGALYVTFYYEYDTSLEDKLQLDYNKLPIGNTSWTGKSSKHLPVRNYRIWAPGTDITGDYHYDYTLDSDGYIASYVVTDDPLTYTDTIIYHYK